MAICPTCMKEIIEEESVLVAMYCDNGANIKLTTKPHYLNTFFLQTGTRADVWNYTSLADALYQFHLIVEAEIAERKLERRNGATREARRPQLGLPFGTGGPVVTS